MVGGTDHRDKDESRKIAIVLIALVVVLVAVALWMIPVATEIVDIHLSSGLGLKDSAVISFFVTLVVMIVFAVASGDGLFGEIQFILSSFFVFFVIIWLLTAWIF